MHAGCPTHSRAMPPIPANPSGQETLDNPSFTHLLLSREFRRKIIPLDRRIPLPHPLQNARDLCRIGGPALAQPVRFGEPSAESTLQLLLGEGAVDTGILQTAAHLVENVKVVLNVFHRDVVRQVS